MTECVYRHVQYMDKEIGYGQEHTRKKIFWFRIFGYYDIVSRVLQSDKYWRRYFLFQCLPMFSCLRNCLPKGTTNQVVGMRSLECPYSNLNDVLWNIQLELEFLCGVLNSS